MTDRSSREGDGNNTSPRNDTHRPLDLDRLRSTRLQSITEDFNRLNPSYNDYALNAKKLGRLYALIESHGIDDDDTLQRQYITQYDDLVDHFKNTYTLYSDQIREYSRQVEDYRQHYGSNSSLVTLPSHIKLMNDACYEETRVRGNPFNEIDHWSVQKYDDIYFVNR